MMRRICVTLPILLLLGCSSGLKHPVEEVTATLGPDSVQHVRVIAHSFWFEPNRIVVKAGRPVELVLKNAAFGVPHNFTCNEADAGVLVSENVGLFGRSKTVRFTPTAAGEYEFFCHVGSHSKKGMKGTLLVVP